MNKYIIYFIPVIVLLFAGIYVLSSKNKVEPISQNQRAYTMELISKPDNIVPGQTIKLLYVIKNDKGEIVTNFEIAHEKIMHFIVVRQDLQDFQHLHPDFNGSTGEFSVDVTFPEEGPYRLFPDFTPGDDNPQKLPVTVYADVDVGDKANYVPQAVNADSEKIKNQDGYQITYTLPERLPKQTELTYTLHLEKDNQPVTNLERYLGALGHSVIIKEGTLDFIHTHAGETKTAGITNKHSVVQEHTSNTSASGPEIRFTTTFPESGIYKIFTQFQHQGKIVTTDYAVNVSN